MLRLPLVKSALTLAIAMTSGVCAGAASTPRVVSNDPKYVLSIPAPISAGDLHTYARWLVLAPPQEQYFERAQQAYLERWNAYWEAHRFEIDALSGDAASALSVSLAAHAPLYRQFAEAEDRAVREMARLDEGLFSELSTFLADSQFPAMNRVRAARQRARACRGECVVAAARVDLSETVASLLAAQEVDEEVLTLIDPVLQEYEGLITPVFAAIDRGWRSFRVEKYELVVVDSVENTEKKRVAALAAMNLQLQAHEINDRFAAKIAAALPSELGSQVLDSYRHSVYALAYFPEPPLAAVLQEAIDTSENAGVRESISVIVTRTNERLESNRRVLESLIVDRQAALVGMKGQELAGITSKWKQAIAERIQVQLDAIKAVSVLATPGSKSRLQKVAEDITANASEIRTP